MVKRGEFCWMVMYIPMYIEQRAWSKAGNQFVYTLFSRFVCTPISCYYQVICSMLTVDVLLGVGSKVCSWSFIIIYQVQIHKSGKETWLTDWLSNIWNPTIFNIIRLLPGSLGWTTHRPSVWCSKHYFFS